MRVSVLIPVHNAEWTVESALASVLRQTVGDASGGFLTRSFADDLEVVVVDDGSTDSTPHILDSIARRDPRVRVIRTARHGIIDALNTGIAECRGELIARMDADDISHPRRLAMQVGLTDERPEVSVCGTLVRMFPRHQLLGGLVRYEQWLNSLVTHEQIAHDIFVESPLAHPSVMMRRKELIEIGGYEEHGWPEDYDLWLRYYVAGKRFAKVLQTLTFWRQSEGRLTFTDPRYSVENFLRAKAHYLAQVIPPPLRDDRVIPPPLRDDGVIPPPLRRGLGGGPSPASPSPQPSPPGEGARPIILWGAGKTGRRLSKHLQREGIDFKAVIDIDPAKIGRTLRGRPIVGIDYLLGGDSMSPANRYFVIAAVSSHGARELIRGQLREMGFLESRDFVCAA